MNLCCLFSLESPHRGDSNEYKISQFQYKTEHHPKLIQTAAIRFFSKGLKKEFETAMINEPSVFEPSKFYCMSQRFIWILRSQTYDIFQYIAVEYVHHMCTYFSFD